MSNFTHKQSSLEQFLRIWLILDKVSYLFISYPWMFEITFFFYFEITLFKK